MENAITVINELIEKNNDRVAGFERALNDLPEDRQGMEDLFEQLIAESQANVAELTGIAQRYGVEPAEGTSTAGALHRAWIDLKTTFTGNDRLAILSECERGEDAIKAVYKDSLDEESDLAPELKQVLIEQQKGIINGHDRIKSLRDQAAAEDEQQNDSEATIADEPHLRENEGGYAAQPSYEGTAGEYAEQSGYIPEPENIVEEDAWQDELENQTGNSKLMEFFINELKDLLWAERELVDTLPLMAEAATATELKDAFNLHLNETGNHVTRLEQIFAILGIEPESRKCDAMAGIIDEGDEIISATEKGTAQRDVGLIFAGQKAEHYEIASYGGMIALAKTLGYYEIAELLVLTLDEEKTADAVLTEIAISKSNYEASIEQAED